MSIPLYIELDSLRTIATTGIKMVERTANPDAVKIHYVGDAESINVNYPDTDSRNTGYDNIVAELQTPTGAVTITSVVPDNGDPIDSATGDTIKIHGTNFANSAKAVATDNANAASLISPVYTDSTLYSVTLSPGALPAGTYSVIYYDSLGQTAILDSAFSVI